MAQPYSNGQNGYGYGYGHGYSYGYSAPIPGPTATSYEYRNQADFQSICDDILAGARKLLRYQFRRNMTKKRLLSFPHLLAFFWVFLLLWGESWIFATTVRSCDWDHWEDWPPEAKPHRLIFIADPQIIDPHSYPGRPWPINPLTMRITDNYMRRSYIQLQTALHPDTLFFVGDLFDGGREWKTAHGDFDDPEWAKDHRPVHEQKLLKEWHKHYGEEYWLQEYARFGRIFYDNWNLGGDSPGPGQRGRKLISSLPGNHDYGFGAEVKIPARHRFITYFGEPNRVDVIGNHTFVSVDTVSLSAGTSAMIDKVDLTGIYTPAEEFLKEVKSTKRRAVEKELRFWRGDSDELTFEHTAQDISSADFSTLPTMDPGEGAPDLPTVLLSHVPLYRDPGTPCGPFREHWPPTKPPQGQTTPVTPDHRNAISISGGYQYQNVLSREDSVNLVNQIGNVNHAFSGDDHDYCEVVHSDYDNIREITIKSFSMAMGVPTPGFQMVSLYNPVDAQGKPLPGSPPKTLQTRLCLLPNQISTYMTYAVLGVVTILVLVARAFLVPVLSLQPFALDPLQRAPSAVLPIFKPKTENEDEDSYDFNHTSSVTSASAPLAGRFTSTRTRGASLSNGLIAQARNPSPKPKGKAGAGKWGWAENRGPRIEIRRDAAYDGGKSRDLWRPAPRPRTTFALITREIWTTSWRVVWIVLLFWAYLTYRG
ncbi:hypothetical protein SLS62_000277 [Diatrype stigma]|uniref:Calcineurin-like phosphoesterase domain-containing protein n=1 Tax=Diatrype stigma TaxID=117547 RepID=A0AAN9UYG2_9PEZI